jgi:phospholipid-binding lipoprotein MlaA
MSMQNSNIKIYPLLKSLIFSITLTSCATNTTTPMESGENDPWEGWNRGTQSFNDNFDRVILKPIAKGYQWITPEIVDKSITNFFSNINDIGVTFNDLLQFKMRQSSLDASRFLINTTAGVAGIFDVAKMLDLPKHNEDFGQTLGVWGVPSGSYLVLPFLGPSSPRDTTGLIGDALLNPLTYVSFVGGAASAATAGSTAVHVTDTRADLLTTEKIVDEASVDRYDFIKNSYLQNRKYLINDGNSVDDDLELNEQEFLDGNESSNKTNGYGTGLAPTNKGSKHLLDLTVPKEK